MAAPIDPFMKKGFLEALAKLGANGQLGQSAGGAGGYAQALTGTPAAGVFGGSAPYGVGQAAGQAATAQPTLESILAAANTPRALGQGLGQGAAGAAQAAAPTLGGAAEATTAGVGGALESAGAGAAAKGFLGRAAAGAGAGGGIGAGLAAAAPFLVAGGINALTPQGQKQAGWSRFGQGAVVGGSIGAGIGSFIPGAGTLIGGLVGAGIGGAGNMLKSNADDENRGKEASSLNDQLSKIDTSPLTELQRKQYGVLMGSALEQLDKSFEDKTSDEYIAAKKSIITNAQSTIDQAKLQNALNPQAATSTQKGFSAQDRMAMQAAIAQFVTPIIEQSRNEIAIGNRSLNGIADRVGGELGDNMRSQAVIRAQGNSAQNAAFAGSLGAQMSLQDLAYQRALNNQVSQMQTSAALQQVGQNGFMQQGGLMGQQPVANPLLAQLAQR
jgi:hypothetical protein